jgi:hypothetical protein
MIERISLFCIVLLVFVGCDWNSDNNHHRYALEATDTYIWTAADFQQLTVQSINGDIAAGAVFSSEITVTVTRRVEGPDEAELEALLDSITVDTFRTDGHLTIDADMPDDVGYEYSADFEILAPPDLTLELSTVNGEVSANGFSAGWSFSTVNGNVTVEYHNGAVHVQSVNGNLDCDLASLEAQEIASLSTVNGNVVLALPGDVSTNFSASTTVGTVEILGFDQVTYIDYEKGLKTGSIGTGSAFVDITTVNGDVTILPRD